jgi:tetratricopeptide (TPR) repeat protein|tara:strand:- start:1085 stop:1519 length:435 start_codon:yes stop_codon:yes gene_type:complete
MKKKIPIILISFFLSILTYETSFAKVAYFEEGKKLFDDKKYKNSKFYFEKDIVFNPKNEKSYLYLAKIFKKQEKDNLVENNLNTVLLLNPQNEEAIYLLTLLNIKKSNFLKAKELILTMTTVCKKMCSTKSELQEKLNSLQKSK